jgi:O-glycosyl hydrolase
MSIEKRDEVLRKLVNPVNGAGMNLIRITLGASDFTSREFYTYNDIPANQTGPNITSFSIQKDIDYNIISTLKRAIELNPNIKIFASSWTAPAWMKTILNISMFVRCHFCADYLLPIPTASFCSLWFVRQTVPVRCWRGKRTLL